MTTEEYLVHCYKTKRQFSDGFIQWYCGIMQHTNNYRLDWHDYVPQMYESINWLKRSCLSSEEIVPYKSEYNSFGEPERILYKGRVWQLKDADDYELAHYELDDVENKMLEAKEKVKALTNKYRKENILLLSGVLTKCRKM